MMDWSYTPEQIAFRDGVRAFIAERLPARYKRPLASVTRHALPGPNGERMLMPGASWVSDRMSDDPQARAAAAEWGAALNSQGWVAAHWPREYGGAGLTTIEQFIFNEELLVSGSPHVGGTGAMFLGSLLMIHGTQAQQAKYMPQIVNGEVEWAQGYSEPGAGSDLASLQLRARRDGDEFVLNGQKIWSTPQLSDAMYALVRTDPDAPKHRGISFLMIEDLDTPGITQRPIANACWDHSRFGETFFEDARVPVANLVGEENRGWYVAMTLMDLDRASISNTAEHRKDIQAVVDFAASAEGQQFTRLPEFPTIRHEVADRFTEVEVGYNLALRLASMQASGLVPNYEASMGKLYQSELCQRIARTSTKAIGLYANLWPGDPRAPEGGSFADSYVRTIPCSIAGGTSEIQRNVIATRGLGLPRG